MADKALGCPKKIIKADTEPYPLNHLQMASLGGYVQAGHRGLAHLVRILGVNIVLNSLDTPLGEIRGRDLDQIGHLGLDHGVSLRRKGE